MVVAASTKECRGCGHQHDRRRGGCGRCAAAGAAGSSGAAEVLAAGVFRAGGPPDARDPVTAPLVLGIETSCDETGAGLVRGRELLADSVASSVDEHARFGGVVPEVASRAHLEAMVATVDRALATAGEKLAAVDGVAVTEGPGV